MYRRNQFGSKQEGESQGMNVARGKYFVADHPHERYNVDEIVAIIKEHVPEAVITVSEWNADSRHFAKGLAVAPPGYEGDDDEYVHVQGFHSDTSVNARDAETADIEDVEVRTSLSDDVDGGCQTDDPAIAILWWRVHRALRHAGYSVTGTSYGSF